MGKQDGKWAGKWALRGLVYIYIYIYVCMYVRMRGESKETATAEQVRKKLPAAGADSLFFGVKRDRKWRVRASDLHKSINISKPAHESLSVCSKVIFDISAVAWNRNPPSSLWLSNNNPGRSFQLEIQFYINPLNHSNSSSFWFFFCLVKRGKKKKKCCLCICVWLTDPIGWPGE